MQRAIRTALSKHWTEVCLTMSVPVPVPVPGTRAGGSPGYLFLLSFFSYSRHAFYAERDGAAAAAAADVVMVMMMAMWRWR